ncbi:Leukotoxin [Roseovarius gaetbuli]|uniref:Leukotoxin n=1 Tax=Roseovarius gaetbuli TaxID=1356575 RepID=A0A1X6ZG16_9RHOB|nr:hypothetical protein [Roseovarius gaetbuli]SLN50649.1 Leukotoxin [Roseovarius gaetbuli]
MARRHMRVSRADPELCEWSNGQTRFGGTDQRQAASAGQGGRAMTTYTVTTSNWNDPAFWSSINLTTAGHTLDVSGLPSDYRVDVDEDTGAIQIAHFGSFFTIVGANYNGAFGAPNATLGGATVINYFSAVAGTGGNDTLASGSGADTVFGNDGNDTVVSGQGDDFVDGGAGQDLILGDGQWYDPVEYASGGGGRAPILP